MWTFSNSTWKGQFKNVQDEISRPLGSQEIQDKSGYSFAGHPVELFEIVDRSKVDDFNYILNH